MSPRGRALPYPHLHLTSRVLLSILKDMRPTTDLHTRLGAGPPAGALQVTIFIPSVDHGGAEIDQQRWRDETLRVLGVLFRGATAFPPGRGVWRNDVTGELVFDDTVMVTCYLPEEALNDATLRTLRAHLHRLGRETHQGEVGIVIGNRYYGITTFDEGEDR